jgi:Na+/H+ antiporter NhaA
MIESAMGIDTLLVGIANFVFIFLKAFQQRNVAFMHYMWVVPTSLLMGIVEVGVVGAVAIKATASSSYLDLWPMIVAIGIGGGLGAVASMFIHKKIFKEKDNADVRREVPRLPVGGGSIQSLPRSSRLRELRIEQDQDPDARSKGDTGIREETL